ncbi:ADP-ribosylglycohydrolase family protein [Arcanobacterium haemolyticum]|nr:ADP-ribosylglycohydrolase family protein [Arcanobacterium haemolyticum]
MSAALTTQPTSLERARGALWGLALGDALGMCTQSMSPADISSAYGYVSSLRDAVASQPIAPSMPAGSITDDTEQALLVGELLIDGGGNIDPMRFATTLLEWEDDMRARGSLDLLGPSTKLALEQVRSGGDPRESGKTGTTNGASMRVAPIGVAFSMGDPGRFGDAVHESCMVTHDTRQGWEAAGLVAGAVSAGISGADTRGALEAALTLMDDLPLRGHWSPKASVVTRARRAIEGAQKIVGSAMSGATSPSSPTLSRATNDELLRFVRDEVGTSVDSTESVAAAFVVAYVFADKPYEGLCFAANLGGDTDTIGAMAGAILGACHGVSVFPAGEINLIREVSAPAIDDLAAKLLAFREA